MFLTTQYLEEADVLADRVGIIHRGHRRRGDPGGPQGGDRASHGRVSPADPEQLGDAAEALVRFGDLDRGAPGRRRGAPPRRRLRPRGRRARSTPPGSRWRSCGCTHRRSTTSSSRRPAARSRVRARTRGGSRGSARVSLWLANVAQLAWRSMIRVLHQPGSLFFALFPLVFLAVIANGLSPADRLPGFPGETGSTSRSRSRSSTARSSSSSAATELRATSRPASSPARARAGERRAARAGASRRRSRARRGPVLPLLRRRSRGRRFHAGPAGVLVLIAPSLVCLSFGALGTAVALRTGSSEAVLGLFPLLRGAVLRR